MKKLFIAGLLFLVCNPVFASTTANLGLTLVDSDATFNGKFKHNVEKGKWQSNYEVAYIFKKSDGVEKTNDFYFQFKENYELTDKLIEDRAYGILYNRKFDEELENTLRTMRAEAFVEFKDLD